MKLYVFNPDADMALGNNEENYMAPATIRRMAEDLALLPIWYAQPGSGVLASSAYNADYLKQMQQLFRLDVHLVTEPELPDYADVRVMPWGWNPAIRKRMLKGGVLEKNLPTPDALDKYRMKAARSNALAFRALFYFNKIDYTCGDGCCLVEADGRMTDISPDIVDRYKEGCVFKSLWSGSGKGLCWCRHGFTKNVSDWCSRALKENRGFVMELYLIRWKTLPWNFIRMVGESFFLSAIPVLLRMTKGHIVVISLLRMSKWRNGFSNMYPLKHLYAYAI